MNLQEIEPLKIFEVIGGSHAYGTNTPESDVDLRGIFMLPGERHLSLLPVDQQVSNDTNDVTFYELKRYLKLASDCNPNIIELLWTPADCIRKVTPAMQAIIDRRHLFISKKAYHTFSGYAHSQISRAKGQNKWINNPQPKEHPKQEDFCYFLEPAVLLPKPPCRPVPYKKAVGVPPLSECRVSSVEHIPNLYRLYRGGGGVFRNGTLVCESISLEDEFPKFVGLFLFNLPAYEAAVRDHKNYWEWMKNRNEARYRSQEAGEIDYDAKNIMHCMRLLFSGENILRFGEPIVRFEGRDRQFLLDIRNGKFAYDDIMAIVEEKKVELDDLKASSSIPDKVDLKKIDALYKDALNQGV